MSYVLFSRNSLSDGTRDRWILGDLTQPDGGVIPGFDPAAANFFKPSGDNSNAAAFYGLNFLSDGIDQAELVDDDNTNIDEAVGASFVGGVLAFDNGDASEWNDVKNIELDVDAEDFGDTITEITINGFVDARVQLGVPFENDGVTPGLPGTPGLAPAKVTIDNVKRGELNLEGSVRGVDAEILLATNNSNWQNSFDVVGSTVDDTITVGRGSFEGQQLANFGEAVVDGSVSTITADLGEGDDTFDASASLAVSDVDGGAGDDTIIGSGGNDMLAGGEGNDTIDGDEGDDTIDGGTGQNTIDGGEGDDTLLLSGLTDAFELVNNNGTIEITEIATGDVSTAVGVESFEFSDGTTIAVEDIEAANGNPDLSLGPLGVYSAGRVFGIGGSTLELIRTSNLFVSGGDDRANAVVFDLADVTGVIESATLKIDLSFLGSSTSPSGTVSLFDFEGDTSIFFTVGSFRPVEQTVIDDLLGLEDGTQETPYTMFDFVDGSDEVLEIELDSAALTDLQSSIGSRFVFGLETDDAQIFELNPGAPAISLDLDFV